MAYGAKGSFVFQSAKTGTIAFNNATFGDPAPGTPKKGYYRLSGGQRFYAHANHLYSVAALTNAAGAVVERYRYDTYGQRQIVTKGADGNWGTADDGVATASAYGNQIGFTGRYLDKETGLWYFRARYYSGSLGRFIGRDPIGYVDGWQLYKAFFIPMDLDSSGKTCCPREISLVTSGASDGTIAVGKNNRLLVPGMYSDPTYSGAINDGGNASVPAQLGPQVSDYNIAFAHRVDIQVDGNPDECKAKSSAKMRVTQIQFKNANQQTAKRTDLASDPDYSHNWGNGMSMSVDDKRIYFEDAPGLYGKTQAASYDNDTILTLVFDLTVVAKGDKECCGSNEITKSFKMRIDASKITGKWLLSSSVK